jgi:hypothetical protein
LAWFGNDFVVFAKGRNAEMAREFLDYIYQADVSLFLCKTAATFPVTMTQSENQGWKKEMNSWPVIRSALARKLKPLLLEKIVPQSREEFSNLVWESLMQPPEVSQRPAKAAELKSQLQKKLSTNPR